MGTDGVKRRFGTPLLAIALLFAPPAANARRHAHANAAGGFDYYLLSLSIAPSFCALSPANRAKAECQGLTEAEYRQTPLTLHGLWPNRAGVSVNRQPQDCPGPPLGSLPASLETQLQHFMAGGPGLAEHEWSRHGTCSGLSPEAYFGAMVRLAQQANETIGAIMREQGMLGQSGSGWRPSHRRGGKGSGLGRTRLLSIACFRAQARAGNKR